MSLRLGGFIEAEFTAGFYPYRGDFAAEFFGQGTMEEGKASGEPALRLASKTAEEFRIGDQIFLLGFNVIQKIELGVGALNLAGAALFTTRFPGGCLDTNRQSPCPGKRRRIRAFWECLACR